MKVRILTGSQDSSVDILRDRDLKTEIRFPGVASGFPLLHSFHTGFETHPASYPVGTRVKAAGT
jgi:hypothetical protein